MPDKPAELEGRGLAYAAMLAVGASCLSPWLAYISAADFFMMEYPQAKLMYVFPIQNMCVLTLGSVVMMIYAERFSLHSRMIVPQVLCAVCMSVVPLLNMTGAPHDFALVATLVAQFCGAVCVTISQSTSYGAGGTMGPEFMNALEAGKGIGGLGIVLARMATKWLLPPTEAGIKQSTNIFFIFSNSLIVLAIVLYVRLLDTPFAKKCFGDYEASRTNAVSRSDAASAAENGVGAGSVEMTAKGAGKREAKGGSEKANLLAATDDSAPSLGVVLKKTSALATIVAVTFLVCLGCFPGLTTSLQSHTLNLGDWFPVILVFFYNTGDLIGKSLPGWTQTESLSLFTSRTIVFPAIAHLCFVPVFFMVAQATEGVLAADQFAFVLAFALGVMTGYIVCACMMFAPSCVEEHEQVMCGQMMSLFLMVGLFAGSLLGMFLSFLLGQ